MNLISENSSLLVIGLGGVVLVLLLLLIVLLSRRKTKVLPASSPSVPVSSVSPSAAPGAVMPGSPVGYPQTSQAPTQPFSAVLPTYTPPAEPDYSSLPESPVFLGDLDSSQDLHEEDDDAHEDG